jgi:hypothetical protein
MFTMILAYPCFRSEQIHGRDLQMITNKIY